MIFWVILLAIIFGGLSGALGAVCVEVYFQRRASDVMTGYEPIEGSPRHAR